MFFDFDRIGLVTAFAGALLALAAMPALAKESTAALLRSGPLGGDAALADALTTEIKAAGYAVTQIDAQTLCDPARLTPEKFDLLVLPDAGPLPAKSMPTIDAYLRGGGDLIALNAPMWQKALLDVNGEWMTRDEWRAKAAGIEPDHVVFDFSPDSIANWRRTSDDMSHPTVFESAPDGPKSGQRALHVTIPELTSWDTCGTEKVDSPFRDGSTLTVFSAKGGPNTTQLSVEWDEKDGSRWIAVVPLTQEWRRFVLAPQDFRFWNSNPKRGFRGDTFHPENAVGMAVGLAFTHTTAVGAGPHEYWVGPFGTAKVTPDLKEILDAFDPPALDTLSPSYKLFECRDVKSLLASDWFGYICDGCMAEDMTDTAGVATTPPLISDEELLRTPATDFPIPSVLRCPHPRPSGAGFDKGRDWRYIPLLRAWRNPPIPWMQWVGDPATLTVHSSGPYKGSVWASFGIGDLSWYLDPGVLKLIRQVAERMRDPVWIIDGGPNFYTYFDGQAGTAGLRVANLGSVPQSGLIAEIEVIDVAANEVLKRSWPLTLAPGETKTVQAPWKPRLSDDGTEGGHPELGGGYTVTATLTRAEKVTDSVESGAWVWAPKKTKHFVTVKDGNFSLDGKRWRAHGVNYMPSSGIGTEDGDYFGHWLGARAYDPEVIQRDLEHIKDIGFNAISVFIYHGHHTAQNLLDLLRRAEELGLKVNLSLRPGTPMDFLWPQISEIIEYYRLWENDTVFAYDLAWEPMFGTREERKIWDDEWEKWIVERYGSIENAEKDWGYKVPRDETGKVTNPGPAEIDTDGDWRVMTAAYRRFLDFLLYKKYGEARRLVRSIDPNHLVSFRMAEAANPVYRWGGRIPYDFPYLAAAVDFLAPEAYGRIGPWERVKPGWFQTCYARWAAPEKPMIWAESGSSTWDVSRMANSPSRLAYAADAYRNMYRLLIETGADVIFHWWYPGGFRVGENSDYGVIEPDGTDREVTKVIREMGPRFLGGPDPKPVDYWIEFDRDKHPDGIAGVYDEVKDEFWKAIADGRTPGLKTEATGTTSADCPLTAVGNTRFSGADLFGRKSPADSLEAGGAVTLSSRNPLKFLDSAIDWVEVRGADGKWVKVDKGASAKIAVGKPVVARVALTNLGEATWLAKGDGAVALRAAHVAAIPAPVPPRGSVVLPNVVLADAAPNGKSEVSIRLFAAGRCDFGERFTVTLVAL